MSARKITRQDIRDAAEKYKNCGKWGPNDEIGTQLHGARGHRRRLSARRFLDNPAA
jgi:hypothetical protein